MVGKLALTVLAFAGAGCSLILDFDSALPADAAIDAVYTTAECMYGEPNDTITDAKDITPTDMGPAAICAPTAGGAEDHDFYRFTATGATATITITFTSRIGGDLDLRLWASDGTMAGQSRGFADNEVLVCPGSAPLCPMLTPGPYVLEVLPGVANAVNNYTFSVMQ
jgi:hypothetical protein